MFFLGLIGLFYIVAGVISILAPQKMLKFVTDLFKKREPKLLGSIPLIGGIFLLLSASASAVSWLIVLLGLGGIAKAVYLFMTPPAKVRSLRWFSLSVNTHRAMGIVILVLGVVVLLSRG